MKNSTIGIIILAAGSSSRMGTSKQLIQVKGEAMLLRTVRVALKTQLSNIVVVLGSNEHSHREVIKDLAVSIVSNPKWKNGIGSSLKTGLNALTNNSIDSCIILVSDQPLLSSDILKKIILKRQSTNKQIIACKYGDTLGVPVLFGSAYFETMKNLPDSYGAKKIVYDNLDDVESIDFPGGEIDLDTPEDLQKFLNKKQ